mmetsp:Transcript_18730/g.47409  ORF Transcript_18730/g.47409 Transcript_18730/m.47409 type:complete len:210 (-) Transcript_18730:675-1304(-)
MLVSLFVTPVRSLIAAAVSSLGLVNIQAAHHVIDRLVRGLHKAPLFQLNLRANALAFDVWKKERRDQALHDRPVVLDRVACRRLWPAGVGLLAGLVSSRNLDAVAESFVKVRIHSALVDQHELAIDLVLPVSLQLLGLARAALHHLTAVPDFHRIGDHSEHLALLLHARQLFRKQVQSRRDDLSLHRTPCRRLGHGFFVLGLATLRLSR